jgi:hypothetical protein
MNGVKFLPPYSLHKFASLTCSARRGIMFFHFFFQVFHIKPKTTLKETVKELEKKIEKMDPERTPLTKVLKTFLQALSFLKTEHILETMNRLVETTGPLT